MKKHPPPQRNCASGWTAKGLSNKDVAKALRLSDGRVVRFCTAKQEPRQIRYPSWYPLRHRFGK